MLIFELARSIVTCVFISKSKRIRDRSQCVPLAIGLNSACSVKGLKLDTKISRHADFHMKALKKFSVSNHSMVEVSVFFTSSILKYLHLRGIFGSMVGQCLNRKYCTCFRELKNARCVRNNKRCHSKSLDYTGRYRIR